MCVCVCVCVYVCVCDDILSNAATRPYNMFARRTSTYGNTSGELSALFVYVEGKFRYVFIRHIPRDTVLIRLNQKTSQSSSNMKIGSCHCAISHGTESKISTVMLEQLAD